MRSNSRPVELRCRSGKTDRREFKAASQGQAIVEYILVVAIAALFALLVVQGFRQQSLGRKLTQGLVTDYKKTYQYGKKTVKGFEDPDGPEDHPRAEAPVGKNFRLFINPGRR